MKKYLFLPLSFLLSVSALADSYVGQLQTTTHRSGREKAVSFIYKIDTSNKENITGTLEISGPLTKCSGQYDLAGGSIKNNSVALITKKHEREGCASPDFKGVVDGNNFVGKITWRGSQNDIVLEKD
jgi:hypothetical protein